jgi:hypothetical protein
VVGLAIGTEAFMSFVVGSMLGLGAARSISAGLEAKITK